MAHYKILPKSFLKSEISQPAELAFNTYLVSIAFRKNEYCLLATLQYRLNSEAEWKIAASNMGSHDGEITIELGSFNPEETLQLFWKIYAPLTKINAIAIYLANKETQKIIKVKPAEGVMTIEKGKNWTDENLNIPLNF